MFKFLFKNDEIYKHNLEQYTKKDAMLAGLIFVIFLVLYGLLGLADKNVSIIHKYIVPMGCLFNVLLIAITLLIVKSQNQGLESLGLKGGWWKTSCIVGIVLGVIVFMGNCGIDLIDGKHLKDAGTITLYIIYFLLVSICEEITFRGFINTRLCAVINRSWVAMLVSGLLFVLMHFPYRMVAYGTGFTELAIGNLGWLIDLYATHIVLSLIYSKTNSLYGAIIPHWISDLAYKIVDR